MSIPAGNIKELLRPFKNFVSKKSISPTYRSILLGLDSVAAAAPDGMLEVKMKLGLEEPIYVPAQSFLSLVESLPEKEKLELTKTDNALAWSCGNAKGTISLAGEVKMPRIKSKLAKDGWKPALGFIDGLQLAAKGCGDVAMASAGLHGIAIYFEEERIVFGSSDNVTISLAEIDYGETPEGEGPYDNSIVISPASALLLADMISEDGEIVIVDGDLLYFDEGAKFYIKQMTELKKDLRQATGKFPARELGTAIPQDAIAAFVKRALALNEIKRDSTVEIIAKNKQLALAFDSGIASSDEFYMAKKLKMDGELRIKVDALRLARALEHVDTVYCDYMEKGALIFTGSDPDFTYLVSGK